MACRAAFSQFSELSRSLGGYLAVKLSARHYAFILAKASEALDYEQVCLQVSR